MMHWWGGRRKKPDTGQANSGLTGDPALEQPPLPEGPKDLRGRWENLKQSVSGTSAALPRVLRLVWDASPATTLGLFATTAIAGVIPAAAGRHDHDPGQDVGGRGGAALGSWGSN